MGCPVQNLTEILVALESITPHDNGCLEIIEERLKRLEFCIERYDKNGVSNLWAIFESQPGPTFVFAGHTDVVPAGNTENWLSPPFSPTTTTDGYLRGRGAVDMKGSVSAMIVAVEQFLEKKSKFKGKIGFLLTSDEEGPAQFGTKEVVKVLAKRQEFQKTPIVNYCLLGEPSSKEKLGDMIRIGRRGSLNAEITVRGVQGHVAYPDNIINPIHCLSDLIRKLCATNWDYQTPAMFPNTGFQVSNIESGTGAFNVVPPEAKLKCNWRFGNGSNHQHIKEITHEIIEKLGISAHVEWIQGSDPFLSIKGPLRKAILKSVEKNTQFTPIESTGGGTSDGRFINLLGCEVIELGLVNKTIHKANEQVLISDLDLLKTIYKDILETLLDKC